MEKRIKYKFMDIFIKNNGANPRGFLCFPRVRTILIIINFVCFSSPVLPSTAQAPILLVTDILASSIR